MRMLNPPHPGDFIRTEIIKGHGLTVTAAAKILDVARPTLRPCLTPKPISRVTWPCVSKKRSA